MQPDLFLEVLGKLPEVDPQADRFLLAVSGGVDSVVLLHLFKEAGLNVGVAHCNFQLREEESDADAKFVETLAKKAKCAFHLEVFPTESYAENNKVSIQEAARELRYHWLEHLRADEGYDWIVTAHHLNDALETFLFNFTKGSGLKGLMGIPSQNDRIIRPLLLFSREQLEQYYQENQLTHREDRTNQEAYYHRNRIRKRVIPVLKEINPSLEKTTLRTFQTLQETWLLFQENIELWRQQLVQKVDNQVQIALSPLLKHPAAVTILYELTNTYGFTVAQIEQALEGAQAGRNGALFTGHGYGMLLNRGYLLIEALDNTDTGSFLLNPEKAQLALPEGRLQWVYHQGQPTTFSDNSWEAWLDGDELNFPLILRRWLPGDVFCPLGMHGRHKKVQDLFTDKKLSRFEKAKIWILENGDGRICWILGLQNDDRFKITASTRHYYHLFLQRQKGI